MRLFVFALFFMFGGITSLNDVVIPKLKGLFTLNYGEVMGWPHGGRHRCILSFGVYARRPKA